MNLYMEATTRIIVDCELLEEFVVRVGLHKGSLLSPFFYSGGRCYITCQSGLAK